jgi:hypothetical protein
LRHQKSDGAVAPPKAKRIKVAAAPVEGGDDQEAEGEEDDEENEEVKEVKEVKDKVVPPNKVKAAPLPEEDEDLEDYGAYSEVEEEVDEDEDEEE